MNKLVYKNQARYRYRVIEPCLIPFVSTATRLAMKDGNVIHPFFTITKEGVFVKAEYAWDGATGSLVQSENLVVASLVHDIGCQAVNLKLLPRSLRSVFDYEYRQQALVYGVSPMRAEIHYAAISLWGKVPKSEDEAPYAKFNTIDIRKGFIGV